LKQDPYVKELASRYRHPAFIDEVGLGSIFGEHVACAVQIVGNFYDDRVNDSKQMKHEELYKVAQDILNNQDPLSFAIHGLGVVSTEELNEIKNMHKANRLAMIRAIKALPVKPDAVFIDGKFTLPESGIENYSIIRGDTKVFGIALASVIAKNYRDHLMMKKYGYDYRRYDILHNKGYRSPRHLVSIRKCGIVPEHRAWMPQIKQVLNGDYDSLIINKYRHYWENM
jgi:ribonuclease HII